MSSNHDLEALRNFTDILMIRANDDGIILWLRREALKINKQTKNHNKLGVLLTFHLLIL